MAGGLAGDWSWKTRSAAGAAGEHVDGVGDRCELDDCRELGCSAGERHGHRPDVSLDRRPTDEL